MGIISASLNSKSSEHTHTHTRALGDSVRLREHTLSRVTHDHTDYNTDESYQARDYLAATMQFIPGHFCCEVVWSTIINVHPRLKMGPNMGVSRGEAHTLLPTLLYGAKEAGFKGDER